MVGRPTRPVLRYMGGKWRLARWIVGHFPSHRIYTEVFGGAASVLMHKPRSYSEVYNDLDFEVVNLFRVLRDPDDAERLRGALRLTPFAREEFDESYEPSDDAVEQARRTVVRCFMGHGASAQNPEYRTGFRFNTYRSGTTAAHDWRNYVEALPAIIDRLRGVVVENMDALELLPHHDYPDSLHYVDPPYVPETRGSTSSTHRYRHEMDEAAHRRLAELLHGAEGAVVLSGYPSDLYEELYGNWVRVDRDAHVDSSGKRTECIWLNERAKVGSQLSLLS